VINLKHICQRAASSFLRLPARQCFRGWVEESHLRFLIGGDDCFANGFDGGGEPAFDAAQFAFDWMFAQRKVDAGLEVFLSKRLEHVTEGLGASRSFEGFVVRLAGEKNDRHIESHAQFHGRLNAVEGAEQSDVHQREIRPGARGFGQRFFPGGDAGGHFVPGAFEVARDEVSHGRVVFDYENSCVRHANRLPLGGDRIRAWYLPVKANG
jgi:hypothetical protein